MADIGSVTTSTLSHDRMCKFINEQLFHRKNSYVSMHAIDFCHFFFFLFFILKCSQKKPFELTQNTLEMALIQSIAIHFESITLSWIE